MKNKIYAYILLSSPEKLKELESNLINFHALPENIKSDTINIVLDMILNMNSEQSLIQIIDDEI